MVNASSILNPVVMGSRFRFPIGHHGKYWDFLQCADEILAMLGRSPLGALCVQPLKISDDADMKMGTLRPAILRPTPKLRLDSIVYFRVNTTLLSKDAAARLGDADRYKVGFTPCTMYDLPTSPGPGMWSRDPGGTWKFDAVYPHWQAFPNWVYGDEGLGPQAPLTLTGR